MTLAISTITAAIAGVSVSGVTILDKSAIPNEWDTRTPILYPEPIGFVSGFKVTRDSVGMASVATKTVNYNLNYTFIHSLAGLDRSIGVLYGDMVSKAFSIIDAILALDTVSGAVTIDVKDINEFGVVQDPSGNSCNGCKISFAIQEFVN